MTLLGLRSTKTSRELQNSINSSMKSFSEFNNPTEEIKLDLPKYTPTLSEGTDASTKFEGVIVACLQNAKLPKDKFIEKMTKDDYVTGFLKTPNKLFATHKVKTTEEKMDILYDFAQVCNSKLPSGKHDAGAGQSKKGLSGFWQETTGKDIDTSKADILIGGKPSSVKGPKAQLMSGKKAEAKATILSALSMVKTSEELKKQLIEAVDVFVDNTRTVGEKVNSGNLKKMTPEQAIESGNGEAKKIVEKQEKLKGDINKLFAKAFNNPEVGGAFAFEAMTGHEKFGGNAMNQGSGDVSGLATHMVIWDYRMDRIKQLPIDKKFASATAKKMTMRADLKSGSYKVNNKKAGYNFYQAIRVSASALLDKHGELKQSANEQVIQAKNQLNEGVISENIFVDKLKDIWNWIKGKLTALWNWFINKITELAEGAKKLINESVSEAMKVFEVDVKVKVNTEVNFK